jgi:hypothetical protein
MVTVTNRLKYRFQFFHHKWGAISSPKQPQFISARKNRRRRRMKNSSPCFEWLGACSSLTFDGKLNPLFFRWDNQINTRITSNIIFFGGIIVKIDHVYCFISVGKVCDLWELCGPDHLMTYKFHVMFFLVLILLRECRSCNFDSMTCGSPKRCWALRSLQTWPGKVWKTWRKQTLDIFSGQSNLGMFHCRLHFLQRNPAIWW